jgi:hypothetical protein
MDSCAGNKPFYIRTWRHVLSGWLHWPEERISRWLQAFDKELEDKGSAFFYHETAVHYMVPLLLRESFVERLQREHEPNSGPPTYRVRHELEDAIGRHHVEFDDGFDWAAARQRVEGVLARHGQTIPGPEEHTSYEERMLRARAA